MPSASERCRTSFTENTSSAWVSPRWIEMPVLASKCASSTRRLPPLPSSQASTRSWFSEMVPETKCSAAGRSRKLDDALMFSRCRRSSSCCSVLPTWRSIRWLPASSCDSSPPPGTSPVSRSEEHTSELQSLMLISYAVFCLQKKKKTSANRQPHDKHQEHQHDNKYRTILDQ